MNGCIYRTEDNKCEFWSDNGKGIVSYCDFDGCDDKKPSNGDRIRSMTDEELADYLRYYSDSYARYDMDWLDWLKEEAKDGE